jgi:hypothetical protein
MSNEREIRQTIRQIVGTGDYYTFAAQVNSIDGATCKVERVLDGKEFDGVRLNAHITVDSGLVTVPKTNSYVLVTEIDGDKWFVSQFSEIDKITIDIDSEVVINGGENGGLIKIEELQSRLKALESKFNSHVHSGVIIAVAGGSGAPATGIAGNSGAPTSTSNEFQVQNSHPYNYENDKIKH